MLMNRLSSLLAVLVLLAPPAVADVLQKSRIPAGARWIAHLDVQAMRSSKLYALVREESANDGTDEVADGLAEFRMFAGLDPTQDFESVTLYSVSFSEKGCVALLAGGAKIDGALEKMKTLENYRTTPVQGHVLHTWGDLGDTWYASVHRVSGSEDRVVVASQDPAQVVRGLSVLAHESESLAEAAQPAIRATPAASSILFAAAGESLDELGRIEPVSAVAKLTKAVVLDVGEDRGALSARVSLDTRTPEDAQRIHQVLQGAVALVGLAGATGTTRPTPSSRASSRASDLGIGHPRRRRVPLRRPNARRGPEVARRARPRRCGVARGIAEGAPRPQASRRGQGRRRVSRPRR
jgi:hypothetical protein